MRSAIVIPVFNGSEQLRACIASLSWVRVDADTHVVVVDSGSTDGSLEWLAANAPWVTVLCLDSSAWWTAAVDHGCAYAVENLAVDSLCLLNHDCRWGREGFDRLRSCFTAHPQAIVCSQVVDLGGTRIIFAGGRRLRTGLVTTRVSHMPGAMQGGYAPVDWCGGMGVIFSSQTYRRVGGFDAAAFPHYFGDTDFCLRARRAGIVTLYCPGSVVINDASSSGVDIPRDSARVRDVWLSLWRRNSVWNVRDNARFYLRHGGLLAPVALGHVYALWAATSAVRLIRSSFR
jgi:N-acetylglucosaminyl-diphospho-decaprenol L-rhamnosyltransferase